MWTGKRLSWRKSALWPFYQARHKSSLLNNSLILTTIRSCYIKFCMLFTHSASRKCEKFYCIVYQNEITLLLITETWRIDVGLIKNCRTLIAFKTSANTISMNTLSYNKCSQRLTAAFVYSWPLSTKPGYRWQIARRIYDKKLSWCWQQARRV